MTEDKTILRLEGVLTIKTAADTRERLLAAFADARDRKTAIEIEISEHADCDLTLPQLLMAAEKSAEAEGIDLQVTARGEGSFATVLARAGLKGSQANTSILRMNGDNT